MDWKFAIRLEVLPGLSLIEKFDNAKKFGFDAVELPGRYLEDYKNELICEKNNLPLPVSSISLGFKGCPVSTDAGKRRMFKDSMTELVDLCAEIKASGIVIPPYLKGDNPENEPGLSTDERNALLIEQLRDLSPYCDKREVSLFLEPVNRYETDFLKILNHAVHICKIINHHRIGITADFFHMQIEELKPDESIISAGNWIKHIHMADNTRIEPGPSSLNFQKGFSALRRIKYNGWIVIECRELSRKPELVLPASANFLKHFRT